MAPDLVDVRAREEKDEVTSDAKDMWFIEQEQVKSVRSVSLANEP